MSRDIYNNVVSIIERFGDRIKSDNHLIIAYYKIYEGVRMNDGLMNIDDFVSSSINPMDIINSKLLYESKLGD